ncbi:LuxR C-terminal-related transcriptional regulator [Streptomyces niveus]|uniref:HTH luxR-type domain-containing protein n=1 Tax=Streptomyces niveus TaxID=193462 RepID=A0A1U9R1N5_STRNV|nr:LuxR C-terminal-related transcriptional regulator [Streptomyces niveus]AQU70438.1 hypothetical protein BBN63_33985 [Streptomyces niveus]
MAAISAGLTLAAGAVAPVSATTSAVREKPAGGGAAAGSVSVRLITGDRVTLAGGDEDGRVVSVEPGKGRKGIVFRTLEEDGRLTILPSDAGELVSAGRLDKKLFDVTALVAQRYDEAHAEGLPLIVAGADGFADAAVRRLTGFADDGSPTRRLDSIDARSVRVPSDDLGAFWFCKAQYVAMPSGSKDAEFDALGRGVTYRVLHEKAFFDDEGAVDNVVAGVADKAIASQMGLSRRTVQRHIQHMMELAGATTRMQLAWQAARRGWL